MNTFVLVLDHGFLVYCLLADIMCSHYFSFYSIVTPQCIVETEKRKSNINTFTLLDLFLAAIVAL